MQVLQPSIFASVAAESITGLDIGSDVYLGSFVFFELLPRFLFKAFINYKIENGFSSNGWTSVLHYSQETRRVLSSLTHHEIAILEVRHERPCRTVYENANFGRKMPAVLQVNVCGP
jgi:hypothetical protein